MLETVRAVQGLNQIDAWPVEIAGIGVTSRFKTLDVHGIVDTTFDLASVSKLLSAYAVLIAVEEGTLGLDEPAGPEGSTVRHLLAHASGLSHGGEVISPPGQRRIYSNAGYDLLGDELEQRSGMAFSEYVSEALFDPLDMSSTRIEGSPAFGGVGTVQDLLAFCRELLSPRLIATETLALATSASFSGLAGVLPGYGRMDPNDWGLGFELKAHKEPHWTAASNSPQTFGHFGAAGTFLWVDPQAQLGCVCLTDREFGDWAKKRWPSISESILESV